MRGCPADSTFSPTEHPPIPAHLPATHPHPTQDALAAQLAAHASKAAARAADAARLQPEIAKLKAAIAAASESVFRDFCARMGVGSAEEWRSAHLTRKPEIDRERKLLKNKIANLVRFVRVFCPPRIRTPWALRGFALHAPVTAAACCVCC